MTLVASRGFGRYLAGLASEINVSYASVVTLICHFMPHFLKLSVKCLSLQEGYEN